MGNVRRCRLAVYVKWIRGLALVQPNKQGTTLVDNDEETYVNDDGGETYIDDDGLRVTLLHQNPRMTTPTNEMKKSESKTSTTAATERVKLDQFEDEHKFEEFKNRLSMML
ncbi:hypothetical protein Droror1_Dr00018201 [Drosera rotundifolia]